ncbi:hypothetical protein BDN70DRAFT_880067 [Pholiota conissans]|uniref:Uncharacterized protein n=1 Tax=Pholiota conissans TaxID=109636 RepID=A0A9P5YZY8_9AGAR|nr:hypothetical protein BDN70DRAFT_880067 [Pholiota conissans]
MSNQQIRTFHKRAELAYDPTARYLGTLPVNPDHIWYSIHEDYGVVRSAFVDKADSTTNQDDDSLSINNPPTFSLIGQICDVWTMNWGTRIFYKIAVRYPSMRNDHLFRDFKRAHSTVRNWESIIAEERAVVHIADYPALRIFLHFDGELPFKNLFHASIFFKFVIVHERRENKDIFVGSIQTMERLASN